MVKKKKGGSTSSDSGSESGISAKTPQDPDKSTENNPPEGGAEANPVPGKIPEKNPPEGGAEPNPESTAVLSQQMAELQATTKASNEKMDALVSMMMGNRGRSLSSKRKRESVTPEAGSKTAKQNPPTRAFLSQQNPNVNSVNYTPLSQPNVTVTPRVIETPTGTNSPPPQTCWEIRPPHLTPDVTIPPPPPTVNRL